MRAEKLVERALKELGASHTSLASARDAAEREGLEAPGHSMEKYSSLLGAPSTEQREGAGADRYGTLKRIYHLPLWPDVSFAVFGTADGQTAGLSFVAPAARPVVLVSSMADLVPWAQTEDQLTELLSQSRSLDEWYPQKDYECFIADDSGARFRYALCFDFGLLQEVKAL
jgi:hypothetical protein